MKFTSVKFLLWLIISLVAEKAFANIDTLKKLTFSAYAEFYYSYDFSNPPNNEKQNFLYNHKRHNQLNANLLLARANYYSKIIRANIGIMAGNYPYYNLSSEPAWAKPIYEANLGIKLFNQKNIWVDAGVFPSHIGFESAISADCWTLTRSVLAENSPYYESGVKVSYTAKNERIFLSALYLNGWQKIQRPSAIRQPSFGLQATLKPSSKIMLNYSNFIGTDKPDSVKAFRHFHNFYLQFEPTQNFGIIAGFDIGFEKTLNNPYSNWYSPVIIVKQRISNNMSVALRAEYYNDKEEVIIITQTPNGFRIYGFSTNFDYNLTPKMKLRIEGKWYNARDRIFANNTAQNNHTITTNFTIKL